MLGATQFIKFVPHKSYGKLHDLHGGIGGTKTFVLKHPLSFLSDSLIAIVLTI
jgi:hypothetical protein